jgi:methionyl-tRNA formyltransferase
MGLRLIFMGTPDFAVSAFAAVQAFASANGHEIVAVYARPPAKQGRGLKLVQAPVHQAGEAAGIAVFTPASLRDEAALEVFQKHEADLAIVVAYGMILPQVWLDTPRLGCWNIHASLLPRWRGAAPIQRAIMAGDTHTGVAIMQMEAGLDTGPVLLSRELAIGPQDTAASLQNRLADLGGQAVTQALMEQASLIAQPQAVDGICYAEKIDKAEARLDFTRSASELDFHIRGLSPFPGAWFEADGERVKVLQAQALPQDGVAGEVAKTGAIIYCGQGALELLRVQKAGKGAMSGEDFMRGRGLRAGQKV